MAAYDEDAIIVGASSILLGYAYLKLLVEENKRERKKRSVWVKEWLGERGAKGAYNALVKQLMLTDARDYRQFMRMEADAFQVSNFVKFHYEINFIIFPGCRPTAFMFH